METGLDAGAAAAWVWVTPGRPVGVVVLPLLAAGAAATAVWKVALPDVRSFLAMPSSAWTPAAAAVWAFDIAGVVPAGVPAGAAKPTETNTCVGVPPA